MASSVRTLGGLVRVGVQLSEEQHSEVEEIARERQTSVSAIIREAVRLYLNKVRQDRHQGIVS